MLVDVAVMLADGGEAIADIDGLRHQRAVFGTVASAPTVWRALDELTPARLRRIDALVRGCAVMCGRSCRRCLRRGSLTATLDSSWFSTSTRRC